MAANRHDEPEVRPPDLNNPSERYEHADVDAWAVGKFGIVLVLLCIFSLLLLFGFFKYLVSDVGGTLPENDLNVDARKLPPSPNLQKTPRVDLQQMRDAEDQILNSYGWVDQAKGVVRVPIDRAIEMLAQRALPARPQSEAPASRGVTVPTESGLGPKMQQPGGPLGEMK